MPELQRPNSDMKQDETLEEKRDEMPDLVDNWGRPRPSANMEEDLKKIDEMEREAAAMPKVGDLFEVLEDFVEEFAGDFGFTGKSVWVKGQTGSIIAIDGNQSTQFYATSIANAQNGKPETFRQDSLSKLKISKQTNRQLLSLPDPSDASPQSSGEMASEPLGDNENSELSDKFDHEVRSGDKLDQAVDFGAGMAFTDPSSNQLPNNDITPTLQRSMSSESATQSYIIEGYNVTGAAVCLLTERGYPTSAVQQECDRLWDSLESNVEKKNRLISEKNVDEFLTTVLNGSKLLTEWPRKCEGFTWTQDFDDPDPDEDEPGGPGDLEITVPVKGVTSADITVDFQATSICVQVNGEDVLRNTFADGKAVDPEECFQQVDTDSDGNVVAVKITLEPADEFKQHWSKLFDSASSS